ncbi:hypothetical protein U91I_04119 [alpha proteobacterium U9-1i]|nr:hypothetical protein U91I_04119 [alpha proteobacterium U9-1i]
MRIASLVLSLSVAALCGASALAQPSATALLASAVGATQSAKADYAFDFHLRTATQGWRARFEPGADPRLRLVSPSRDQLNANSQRAFDNLAEQLDGVSWCASEGMDRVTDVSLMREDADTATYSFQPTRESIRGATARQFADRLRGEVTITKIDPDVTHLRVFAPAPFSPLPLTQLQSFNLEITCQVAPNGRRYAAETAMELRGQAFGQAIDERTFQRAENLTAP